MECVLDYGTFYLKSVLTLGDIPPISLQLFLKSEHNLQISATQQFVPSLVRDRIAKQNRFLQGPHRWTLAQSSFSHLDGGGSASLHRKKPKVGDNDQRHLKTYWLSQEQSVVYYRLAIC